MAPVRHNLTTAKNIQRMSPKSCVLLKTQDIQWDKIFKNITVTNIYGNVYSSITVMEPIITGDEVGVFSHSILGLRRINPPETEKFRRSRSKIKVVPTGVLFCSVNTLSSITSGKKG